MEALENRRMLSGVVVNTIADSTDTPESGVISLRDAIAVANASSTPTTITFDPTVFALPQSIMLNGTPLELSNTGQPTTITAPAAGVTISGLNQWTAFEIDANVAATLSGLTVTDTVPDEPPTAPEGVYSSGNATLNNDTFVGGGVQNNAAMTLTNTSIADFVGYGIDDPLGAAVTLDNVTISGLSAFSSYGLYNDGTASLSYVNIIGVNSGIHNTGQVTAGNVAIPGSLVESGIINSGNLTLADATISGGMSTFDSSQGGGIRNSGNATLTDVTITGNNFLGNNSLGAGLYNSGTATLSDDTIADNTISGGNGLGGGIFSLGSMTLANCIVAGDSSSGSGPDVAGSFTSLGDNLIGQTDGSSGWTASDLTGTAASPLNADLGTLANNGGATLTLLPQAGSPAIDAGSNALIPAGITNDQRGLPRIVNGTVDIGAVEVQPITVTPPGNQTAQPGQSQVFVLGSFTALTGNPPYAVDVNWGDGTVETMIGNLTAAGAIPAAAHTYAKSGNDTVSITVTDAAGDVSNSPTFGVHVATAVAGNADTITYTLSINDDGAGHYAVYTADTTNNGGLASYDINLGNITTITNYSPKGDYDDGSGCGTDDTIGFTTLRTASNVAPVTASQDTVGYAGGGPVILVYGLGQTAGNLAADAAPGSTGADGATTQAVYAAAVELIKGTFTGAAPVFANTNSDTGNVFLTHSGFGTAAPVLAFNTVTLVGGRTSQTVVVNTTADSTDAAGSGVVSLRDAIALANASTLPTTIAFDPTVFATAQTIVLSQGDLELSNTSQPTTITGPAAGVTVDGNLAWTAFAIAPNVTATLSGLTVTSEPGTPPANSDVIFNAGNLTLNNDHFTAGTIASGTPTTNAVITLGNDTITNVCGYSFYNGNRSTAVLNNVTVCGLSADSPAGIYNNGTATLNQVSISHINAGIQNNGNLAGGNITVSGSLVESGIINAGNLTLVDATIPGGMSSFDSSQGGGIRNAGNATIVNVTITGNNLTGNNTLGAGLYNSGTAVLYDDTIADNTISGHGGIGGGIFNLGSLTLANCIVTGDTSSGSGPDVTGSFTSLGYNLIGATDSSNGWLASDLTGTAASPLNANLGPLANNGGPTQTLLPLAGSPVIDAGFNALIRAGITTDQRGLPRIVNGTVDIGAVEVQPATTTTITLTPPANQAATAGQSQSITLGSFVESNATGPYSVDINWGDGTADSTLAVSAAGTIPATAHIYAASGNDKVALTVTDAAGDVSNNPTFSVNVAAEATGGATITYTLSINDDGAGHYCDGHYAVYASDTTSNGGLASYDISLGNIATITNYSPKGDYDDGTGCGTDDEIGFTVLRTAANAAPVTASQDTAGYAGGGAVILVYGLGQTAGNLAADAAPGSTGVQGATTQAVYGAAVELIKGTFTGAAPVFINTNSDTGNVFSTNSGYGTAAPVLAFNTVTLAVGAATYPVSSAAAAVMPSLSSDPNESTLDAGMDGGSGEGILGYLL